jgi:hypothetical protein
MTPMSAPFPIAPCAGCGAEVPNPDPIHDPIHGDVVVCDDCLDADAGRTCSFCDAECGGHY